MTWHVARQCQVHGFCAACGASNVFCNEFLLRNPETLDYGGEKGSFSKNDDDFIGRPDYYAHAADYCGSLAAAATPAAPVETASPPDAAAALLARPFASRMVLHGAEIKLIRE